MQPNKEIDDTEEELLLGPVSQESLTTRGFTHSKKSKAKKRSRAKMTKCSKRANRR